MKMSFVNKASVFVMISTVITGCGTIVNPHDNQEYCIPQNSTTEQEYDPQNSTSESEQPDNNSSADTTNGTSLTSLDLSQLS